MDDPSKVGTGRSRMVGFGLRNDCRAGHFLRNGKGSLQQHRRNATGCVPILRATDGESWNASARMTAYQPLGTLDHKGVIFKSMGANGCTGLGSK